MGNDQRKNPFSAAAAIVLSFAALAGAGCQWFDEDLPAVAPTRIDFSGWSFSTGVSTLELAAGQTGSVKAELKLLNELTPATSWRVDPIRQEYAKQISLDPTENSASTTITVVASDWIPESHVFKDSEYLEVPVLVTATTGTESIPGKFYLRLKFPSLETSDFAPSCTKSLLGNGFTIRAECIVSVTNEPTADPYQYYAEAYGGVGVFHPEVSAGINMEHITGAPSTIAIVPSADGRRARISLEDHVPVGMTPGATLRDFGWSLNVVATAGSHRIRRKFRLTTTVKQY